GTGTSSDRRNPARRAGSGRRGVGRRGGTGRRRGPVPPCRLPGGLSRAGLADHRSARLRPLHRGPGLRRDPAVRAGPRLRPVPGADADRMSAGTFNVLLKSIEEPPPATVWMLCAPSAEDLAPTIRSRCRLVTLSVPPSEVVAELLRRRDGIDEQLAVRAARAA